VLEHDELFTASRRTLFPVLVPVLAGRVAAGRLVEGSVRRVGD
jgi:hypothetical protein